jgi:hypothetical protein
MAYEPDDQQDPGQEPHTHVHTIWVGKVQARIYWGKSLREEVPYRVMFLRTEGFLQPTSTALSFFLHDLRDVSLTASASLVWLIDRAGFVPSRSVGVVEKPGRERSLEHPPAYEVRCGDVLASIYENDVMAGEVYYTIGFRRVDPLCEEIWCFRPEDLSHVARAATECSLWSYR